MNEQTQPGTACVSDSLIAALFNVADDHEASTLQDLLVKCGELWRCSNCAATFDWDVASCEFCGTAQPARPAQQQKPASRRPRVLVVVADAERVTAHTLDDVRVAFISFGDAPPEGFEDFAGLIGRESAAEVYARHFRVEFDLEFWGGNFAGVGQFSFVPFSLIEGTELTPEQAFTQHTGIDAAHIIHYTLDESYDAAGERYDEGLAETIAEMRELFAYSAVTDVVNQLAHFCDINESYGLENASSWRSAKETLDLVSTGIAESGNLPATLAPRGATEREGEMMAAVLGSRTIVEALKATAQQARFYGARADAQHAAAWKEATARIAEAAETLESLPPTSGLNS